MSTLSPIRHVTFDCADAHALAMFWSAVTGWPIDEEAAPGDDEVGVVAPEPLPMLLFIHVPEGNEFCVETSAAERAALTSST